MLGLSIFCTILFSFIAFPGIIHAAKANTQFALGNVDEAIRLNKKASIWCWVSAIAIVIFLALQFGGMASFDFNKNFKAKTSLKEKII